MSSDMTQPGPVLAHQHRVLGSGALLILPVPPSRSDHRAEGVIHSLIREAVNFFLPSHCVITLMRTRRSLGYAVLRSERAITLQGRDTIVMHVPVWMGDALPDTVHIRWSEADREESQDAILTLTGHAITASLVSCGGLIVQAKHPFAVGTAVQLACTA